MENGHFKSEKRGLSHYFLTLDNMLDNENFGFLFSFFFVDHVPDHGKVNRKKTFTLKKIKKYAEKHEKSENVRKV